MWHLIIIFKWIDNYFLIELVFSFYKNKNKLCNKGTTDPWPFYLIERILLFFYLCVLLPVLRLYDLQIPEHNENNVWAIQMFLWARRFGRYVYLKKITHLCMQWNYEQHLAHMDWVNYLVKFVIWNKQAFG